jgi:hypothetical protein
VADQQAVNQQEELILQDSICRFLCHIARLPEYRGEVESDVIYRSTGWESRRGSSRCENGANRGARSGDRRESRGWGGFASRSCSVGPGKSDGIAIDRRISRVLRLCGRRKDGDHLYKLDDSSE